MNEPVSWVERKVVNWPRVQALLSAADEAHQWTNFGPVSRLLEQRIAEILKLPADKAVVATASGTAALEAISALEEHKRGHPVRWVVSDFGFHCSRQGAFRNATVIDCDDRGVLDLRQLARHESSSYDAVLVTNPFGVLDNFSEFLQFGHDTGKLIVADSAGAFDAAHSDGSSALVEALSFHHTKPWGFGEGGAMVVAAEDEDMARSVINFGLVSNVPVAGVASNGKLSDVGAAFILSWLDGVDTLRDAARGNFERIVRLGSARSWNVLGAPAVGDGIRSCVPLLWPRPLPFEAGGDDFMARRYYQPLTGLPVASGIYSRIVNLPCHADMSSVPDQTIDARLALIEQSD